MRFLKLFQNPPGLMPPHPFVTSVTHNCGCADVPTITSIAGVLIILTGLSWEMSNASADLMECSKTAAETFVRCIKILKSINSSVGAGIKAAAAATPIAPPNPIPPHPTCVCCKSKSSKVYNFREHSNSIPQTTSTFVLRLSLPGKDRGQMHEDGWGGRSCPRHPNSSSLAAGLRTLVSVFTSFSWLPAFSSGRENFR